MTDTRVQIRPGYVVVDASSASGGVHYERTPISEEQTGDALRAEHKTVKRVDHIGLCKEADALVKTADYLCRTHCARTTFGWYADDDAIAPLRTKIAELEEKARDFNERAAAAACARRVHVGVVCAKIDVASEGAAREIARTVRDALIAIRDALRAADIDTVDNARRRARGIEKLAVGVQGDAVEFAVESANGLRDDLRDWLSDKAATWTCDTSQIDAAIELFTPREETTP